MQYGLCLPQHPVFCSHKFTTHNEISIDFGLLFSIVKRSVIIGMASVACRAPTADHFKDESFVIDQDVLSLPGDYSTSGR